MMGLESACKTAADVGLRIYDTVSHVLRLVSSVINPALLQKIGTFEEMYDTDPEALETYHSRRSSPRPFRGRRRSRSSSRCHYCNRSMFGPPGIEGSYQRPVEHKTGITTRGYQPHPSYFDSPADSYNLQPPKYYSYPA